MKFTKYRSVGIGLVFVATLMLSLFWFGTEQAAAFKFRLLKGDCCGSMPIMDAVDPGGPIANFVGLPEVQSCLNKGGNIALVDTGKGTAPYCWEPEPPVKLDPRDSAARSTPVDAAAVSAYIACWNRNGSVTLNGRRLSCINTPQELRHSLDR